MLAQKRGRGSFQIHGIGLALETGFLRRFPMPRRLRLGLQGMAFHVMNRAVRRTVLFESDRDYQAFLKVVRESLMKYEIKIIAYEVMPNHWHFVVICDRIEEVSNWLHWVTGTHAIRWNLARGSRGSGAVYHSRFKAVPIQRERSLIRVCRYVERNGLRAGLVQNAELWQWGSLYAVCNRNQPIGDHSWQRAVAPFIGLSMRPIGRPKKDPRPL